MAKLVRLRQLAASDVEGASDSDLRARPMQGFPYVVFYVVTDDEVDVWRILHTRRDAQATIELPET